MKALLNIAQQIFANLVRKRSEEDMLRFQGIFSIEHWRDGECINVYPLNLNGITDQGKKEILEQYFYFPKTGRPIDDTTYSCYIGLINTGATLNSADTYTTHTGWTEYANYTVGGSSYRGKWTTSAATGTGTISITNPTPITYDITGAGGTVYGIFVCTGTTTQIRAINDVTAGNELWATGAFTAEIPVVSGDQLKITYTVNC